MIVACNGITIRMEVEGIRETGRSTQGVKLINLQANGTIGSIERMAKIEVAEEDGKAPASRPKESRFLLLLPGSLYGFPGFAVVYRSAPWTAANNQLVAASPRNATASSPETTTMWSGRTVSKPTAPSRLH